MSKPIYSWKAQHKLGVEAEMSFLEIYHLPLILLDGRKGDFQVEGTSKILELKTCSKISKTGNFFFERWNLGFDPKTKTGTKPGGPWQSLEHGAELFVYLCAVTKSYWEFNTEELVRWLNEYESANLKKIKTVTNVNPKGGFKYAGGYTIKKEEIRNSGIVSFSREPFPEDAGSGPHSPD